VYADDGADMNQDDRLQAIMERVARHEALTEVHVPPELASPSSFLKVLTANHYNWESTHFRKLFGMRFSVKIPPIEQLNCIFYPRQNYDVPVFIFFCMLTKRKVIAHLNLNCPFEDAEYRAEWEAPFTEILNNFEPFVSNDRYPEWMKKYRNSCTIYGLFSKERVKDLSDCAFRYLDLYMSKVSHAQPTEDPARLQVLKSFHDQWVDDLRTQDKAQGMIAKMIGAKTAKRIFYEVTT
jgi:hypothetical protein